MEQQLDELMPEIIKYFEQQASSLKQQLDTLSSEQLKQREGNIQSSLAAVEIVAAWKYLKDWRMQLLEVQQYIPNATLTTPLSSNYLHEVESDKAEKEILQLTDLMYDIELQEKGVNRSSIDIDIPSQLLSPTSIPTYLLYSFKPALLAVLFASLLFIGVLYKDEVKYNARQMFASLVSEADNKGDSSKDYTYMEANWTGEESAGKLYTGNSDLYVYSEQNSEYPTKYLLPEDTTWEVYFQEGDWYRIQDNLWVKSSDTTEYYEDLIAYEQPYIDKSIGQINDNGYQTPVYNRASRDAEIIGFLNNSDYEVSHLTEEGWMKMGADAWIIYHDNINFYQQVLESNLRVSSDFIRTEQVKADFIPVFESDSRESDVIGYLANYLELQISNFQIESGRKLVIMHGLKPTNI